MICPECGKEISYVHVYSQAVQKGFLTGNKIVDYDSPEIIGGDSDIECPECGNSLNNSVEE